MPSYLLTVCMPLVCRPLFACIAPHCCRGQGAKWERTVAEEVEAILDGMEVGGWAGGRLCITIAVLLHCISCYCSSVELFRGQRPARRSLLLLLLLPPPLLWLPTPS